MDNIHEVLNRADLSRICFYLLNGADFETNNDPFYTKQVQKTRMDFTHKLQNRLADAHEFDVLMEPFYDYEEVLQNTCMEIGLKCGFKLALQLLSNSDADYMAAINKAFSFGKESK